MKKACYDNLIIIDYEIDGKREPPEQATSELTMNILIEEGVLGNIAGAGIKHSQKFFAKSW